MSHNILVAYDGTAQGENAFQAALHLAQSLSGRLWVVAVIELPHPPGEVEMTAQYMDTKETYEFAFNRMKAQATALQVPLEWVIRVGRPHEQVIAEIRERSIKYLVIGNKKSRVNLMRWLFSSTLDELVRQAPCPVLVVH